MPVAPAINPCLLSVLVLFFIGAPVSLRHQNGLPRKNTYCFRATALSNLFCEIFFSVHDMETVGFTSNLVIVFEKAEL
jgi:hypothetical protein